MIEYGGSVHASRAATGFGTGRWSRAREGQPCFDPTSGLIDEEDAQRAVLALG